jgi:hypothetical protein
VRRLTRLGELVRREHVRRTIHAPLDRGDLVDRPLDDAAVDR